MKAAAYRVVAALFLCLACVTTVHASLEVTQCKITVETADSVSVTRLSITPFSNVIEGNVTGLPTGTVDFVVTCEDASRTAFYSTVMTRTVSSVGETDVLLDIAPSSISSFAGTDTVPYFTQASVSPGATAATVTALAKDFSDSTLSYTISESGSSIVTTPGGCSSISTQCTGEAAKTPADTYSIVATASDSTGNTAAITVMQSGGNRMVSHWPRVTLVESSADAIDFGESAVISAQFIDLDVGLAGMSHELTYTWSVDHVDASNTVLTAGGGTTCAAAWIVGGNGTTGSVLGNGLEQAIMVNIAPTGTGPSRFCRYTLTVVDWFGTTGSSSVTVEIGDGLVSSTTVFTEAPVVPSLPMLLSFSGTQLEIFVAVADKCEGIICPSEDQCLSASICDSSTGICSTQIPKTGLSCDDGDDTTRDDTCTSAGTCQGIDKCLGVVCPATSTCHNNGTCEPTTGVCSPSYFKDVGEPCDDKNATTAFDVCVSIGVCQGTDIADLVTSDTVDFTQFSGMSTDHVFSSLSALPNVCCDSDYVCCTPCTTSCTDGDYTKVWYLQQTLQ
eukprot:m.119414 g.119414  ORF g.119414 m.119414 type:complete len:560 (-) comp13676_c1_seq7:4858-6537(-)